jgi:hypothetical protein
VLEKKNRKGKGKERTEEIDCSPSTQQRIEHPDTFLFILSMPRESLRARRLRTRWLISNLCCSCVAEFLFEPVEMRRNASLLFSWWCNVLVIVPGCD